MGLFDRLYSEPKKLHQKALNPYFGVEVLNMPKPRKISDFQIENLKALISRYGLVVLRNKVSWTEEEQVKFTQMLGVLDTPVIYSTTRPSDPKIKSLWPKAQQSGLQWHSDRSFMQRPSHLSIFQMVERPSIGNETSFVSLSHVYDNLKADIKAKWSNYKIVYATEKIVHPLFWTHPFNGNKTIYFDFRFAERIVDRCDAHKLMDIVDVNEVIQEIAKAYSEEKAKYNHIWKKNDILITDNYAISHKANIVSETEESRVLIRSSTQGVFF